MKKSLWQKQFPTMIGIAVLVIALVIGVGVFTFQQGPAVFAPRATPQTSPKKIKVTNVTDTSFTVTFFTDDKIAGFVKYGTEANALKSQASDDRDQLAGSVGTYNLHHITIRGLQPNTAYHYMLGTGSRDTFDNNGTPFTITTAKRAGAPSAAKTVYGNILDTSGGPADGAIVYLSIDGVSELSSLVKNSGSWAVPLSNARTSDGSGYAEIGDDKTMVITVQGNQAEKMATLSTTVGKSQPVETITLAAGGAQLANTTNSPSPSPTDEMPADETDTTATPSLSPSPTDTEDASASAIPSPSPSPSSSASAGLDNLLADTKAATTSATIVDLTKASTTTVNTTQPIIKGETEPNTEITIEIHSQTAITTKLTTDDEGKYQIDIKKLSQSLEPGEHTITISYTDPVTGEKKTETKTFYVAAQAAAQTKLASAASPSPSASTGPYGTGSPYSLTSPSPATNSTDEEDEESTASSIPATKSAMPVSGSVGTTLVLILGGLFFLLAGGWSFWIAYTLQEDNE